MGKGNHLQQHRYSQLDKCWQLLLLNLHCSNSLLCKVRWLFHLCRLSQERKELLLVLPQYIRIQLCRME